MPYDALLKKLGVFSNLTEDEKALLRDLASDVRIVAAGTHILRDGERPEYLHLIVEGWAIRYKVLEDGTRQITAFLLPGDFCDLHVTILGKMDHGIETLTECRVAFVRSVEMDRLTSGHNGLTKALWLSTLVDEAVLRAWIVNHGRREAHARIAHLLCELHVRMTMIGLVEEDRFNLPLTQAELADALGFTSVHVNRVLQRLRKANLIELRRGVLTVLDVGALHRLAGFDPSYLHIERRELVADRGPDLG